jgi:polyhydroxyalkanoate synthase
MGQKPPSFDLLYWNSDNTRMTRNAHSFYMRNTYLENNLIEPDKVKLDDVPIDLGRIKQDVYAVGAEKDHIVPWKSAWSIGQLTNVSEEKRPHDEQGRFVHRGNTRFVLANSGHIAGIINHPAKGKGKHWVNESGDAGSVATAEEWREKATEHEGSWWTDWAKWLSERSGKKADPPKMGSEKYPPLEDAPGTYVKER